MTTPNDPRREPKKSPTSPTPPAPPRGARPDESKPPLANELDLDLDEIAPTNRMKEGFTGQER